MACDICAKPSTNLQTVAHVYATDDIKCVCPRCANILNKQLEKIKEMHRKAEARLTKSWMNTIRDRFFNPR